MSKMFSEFVDFIKEHRSIVIIVSAVMFGSVVLSLPTIFWHDVAFFYYLAWLPLLIQWLLYYICLFILGTVIFSLFFTVVVRTSNGRSDEAKKRWLVIIVTLAVLTGLVALYGFIVFKAEFIPPFSNTPFVPLGYK